METPQVMVELRRVLTETRQPPGQDPVATYSEVAGRIKVNENVVRKFERGDSAPNYERLDAFIAAYSDSTGVSVFALWDAAIDRAKKADPADVLPTPPPGEDPAVRQAKQEAEREESELDREVDDDDPQSDSSEQRDEEDEPGSESR